MVKMNAYQEYLLQEFVDDYHERQMTRRDLMRRAVLIMGTAPLASAALLTMGCGDDDDAGDATATVPAAATTAAATTGTPATAAPSATGAASAAAGASPSPTLVPVAVTTTEVKFAGPGSDLVGTLSRPTDTSKSYPGVFVIHENRGLTDHIKDVAKRYAGQGFVALAIDLVSRKGGSTADTTANMAALAGANVNIEDLVADTKAYATYLQGLDGVRKNGVGVTGFCFGGGYAFEAAIAAPEVVAAVPYYGICRLMEQLASTKAAVMVMYGANDARVTAQAEQVRAQLAKTGRPNEVRIYEGANHAFFNDTGANYNATVAADAWPRTLDWFRAHLPKG